MKAVRWNLLIVSALCLGLLGCPVPQKSGERESVLAALEAEDPSVTSLLEQLEPSGPLSPTQQPPTAPPNPQRGEGEAQVRALIKRLNLERVVTRVGGPGQLDTPTMSKVFRRRQRGLSVCFYLASKDVPELHGKVGGRLTVTTEGRLAAVTVTENTTGSAALVDCLTTRIERLRTPKPAGGVAEFTWAMELPPL